MKSALRGLYAITSAALCRQPQRLDAAAAAALAGGARLLQYRDKENDATTRESLARHLLALCHARGALLIINDDVALARRIRADGVHLGAGDASLREARSALHDGALIGVSCANQLSRALEAQDSGADYVAFGRFFASNTKPDAPLARLSVLRDAKDRLHVPVCAIGGITPDNAGRVVAAGADLVAAVEGVFGAADIVAAARAYARCFAEPG